MEKIMGVSFAELIGGGPADRLEFARQFCRFFKEMTCDTVSFEVCITEILPDHGAIMGGRPGPIQSRADFEFYPWEALSRHDPRRPGAARRGSAVCIPVKLSIPVALNDR